MHGEEFFLQSKNEIFTLFQGMFIFETELTKK